jgi:hypothetical protein
LPLSVATQSTGQGTDGQECRTVKLLYACRTKLLFEVSVPEAWPSSDCQIAGNCGASTHCNPNLKSVSELAYKLVAQSCRSKLPLQMSLWLPHLSVNVTLSARTVRFASYAVGKHFKEANDNLLPSSSLLCEVE